jgi:hypothetical protein
MAGRGGRGGTGGGSSGGAGGNCSSVPTYGQVRDTILTPRCAGRCHGGTGGLTPSPAGPINLSASSTRTELVDRDSVLGMGLVLVRAGNPNASFLMDKLTNNLPADSSRGSPMPQGEAIAWRMIPQAELDQIRCWIAGGAP